MLVSKAGEVWVLTRLHFQLTLRRVALWKIYANSIGLRRTSEVLADE
ncbi:hypothetical protein X749_31335 [Mesorhizobium sp. LNJC391B00]|nr:hypothetical protein X749_31335 [Mesorhizobium sp. LNJC391B00]